MSSTSSWASTTTPAPDLTPSSALGGVPSSVLARGQTAASERETTLTIKIQQLRDRSDALRLELDAVADATEAAKMATRHAERRAREAAAELRRLVATRTSGTQAEKKLQELSEEVRDNDARIKLLEAIVATLANKWRQACTRGPA